MRRRRLPRPHGRAHVAPIARKVCFDAPAVVAPNIAHFSDQYYPESTLTDSLEGCTQRWPLPASLVPVPGMLEPGNLLSRMVVDQPDSEQRVATVASAEGVITWRTYSPRGSRLRHNLIPMSPHPAHSDGRQSGKRGSGLFAVHPPKGFRDGLWRLLVALIVMGPLCVGAALVFDLVGWPSVLGVAIGTGVGASIAGRLYDRRGR